MVYNFMLQTIMNRCKILYLLRYPNFIFPRQIKLTQSASSCLIILRKYSTPNVHAEELIVREKIQLSKPSITKWKRPPFLKDFFFGKFDTELMSFPEILNKEQLTELESVVKSINALYTEKVNSLKIDEGQDIPQDFLQELKDMGLFGRTIPSKYGGLDLTHTACTRLNEVLGLDWSVYSTLAAHEFFASQIILKFGSEDQKNKYLPYLATGKFLATVCCSEFESGCDLLSISTYAKANPDGSFIINGSKSWVTNAELADVFIVFAKTQNSVDPKADDISVFIVDSNKDGVTVLPQEAICLRGIKSSIVHFKEVTIPRTNLIGTLGMGFQVYLKSLESLRIALSTFTFGTLKILLDSVTERIINSERIERSLGDIQLMRQRLSRISCMLYAMESVSYFTSALIDSTENPDIEFESAAMKVFNSEGTLYCLKELMETVGSSSLMKEQHLERYYRDALGLAVFDSPNDIARLYIGLSGCKLVGAKKAEDILKMRNRFFFPADALKDNIKRYRLKMNLKKYDQDIAGHIHPSLVLWGNELEEALQRFEIAVEDVLSEHGIKVVDTQIFPKKLANAAIDLYAMSAVLSRCSRSYCIGLKNCHHEVRLVDAFCYDTIHRIRLNLNDIFAGIVKCNEADHLLLGEQIIDCRGYFPEHPLKHNF